MDYAKWYAIGFQEGLKGKITDPSLLKIVTEACRKGYLAGWKDSKKAKARQRT